jgi:hypothetical protein
MALFLHLFALAIVALGLLIAAWPAGSLKLVSAFYRNYPIVRLAPNKQFVGRPAFMRALGVVLVFVGAVGLWSLN